MTIHRPARAKLLPLAAALCALVVGAALVPPAHASSHREAPFITTSPRSTAPTSTCSELRARARRLRHADRELPAAAGSLRRTELLHARPERALRDPRRQQRRREGRHHLPVPLQEQARRHHASDRRQERRHPADPGGSGHRRAIGGAERQRDLHGRRRARRSPAAGAPPSPTPPTAATCSTSRSTTSAPRRCPTTRPTPRSTSTTSTSPAADAGQAVRRPAEGPVRGQPGRHLRPRERAAGGDHRPDADQCRAEHDRRQERHDARARGAQELPPRPRSSDPVIGGWTTASLRQVRCSESQPAGGSADHRDRRRRVDAGLAPRHAARQRSRDRPARQGPVQQRPGRRTTDSSPTT